MGKKKVPKEARSRPDTKNPRLEADAVDQTPSWRFSMVDKDGPFAWPTDAEANGKIVEKLKNFDSMRWSEIEGRDHHSIPTGDLSKAAKERLVKICMDDVDEVFSFHLAGKPRIFCIRVRGVAKLLWYDPDHGVCLSNKKHT